MAFEGISPKGVGFLAGVATAVFAAGTSVADLTFLPLPGPEFFLASTAATGGGGATAAVLTTGAFRDGNKRNSARSAKAKLPMPG